MAILARKSNINSNINVTPMVDVMLVLLIIFMVITPMLNGIHVQLAKTANPITMADADREDALVIAVLHDGRIFLGTELITSQDLIGKVKDRVSNRNNRTVYVRADARARYEYVVHVVESVRSAGADQLGLLTEQAHNNRAL